NGSRARVDHFGGGPTVPLGLRGTCLPTCCRALIVPSRHILDLPTAPRQNYPCRDQTRCARRMRCPGIDPTLAPSSRSKLALFSRSVPALGKTPRIFRRR